MPSRYHQNPETLMDFLTNYTVPLLKKLAALGFVTFEESLQGILPDAKPKKTAAEIRQLAETKKKKEAKEYAKAGLRDELAKLLAHQNEIKQKIADRWRKDNSALEADYASTLANSKALPRVIEKVENEIALCATMDWTELR